MKRLRIELFLLMFVTSLSSTQVLAQSTPLADFVNDPNNGASALQQQMGFAVAGACTTLNAYAQSLGLRDGFALPGAQGDLFARCNEMMASASVFVGGSFPTDRDLDIGVDGLLAALQQVSGEELLSQGTLSTRVSNGQFSNIAGRLNAVRVGGASAAMGGRVAATGTYDDPGRSTPGYRNLSADSRTLTGGAAGDADFAGSRLGWFLEGSINTGDRDQTASEDGFDFDATSITIGIDYMLNSGVIGASVGFDNYDADFQNNMLVAGGNVEVAGTSGSLFGAMYRDAWYFDGIVSFGNLDTDTTRIAFYPSNNPACVPACPGENDTLLGQTDGDYVAAGATVGYDVTRGNWEITPSLSLAHRDISVDGYNETDPMGGGLMLSYAEQEMKSLKSVLGVSFTGNFSKSFGILSPQFRLEWHHEFEDDPARLVAKYALEEQLAVAGVTGAAGAGVFTLSQCISCFVVNGDEIDTDFGLIGIGVAAVFTRRIQIYGSYDALVGLDNLSSNAFSVGIRGQF